MSIILTLKFSEKKMKKYNVSNKQLMIQNPEEPVIYELLDPKTGLGLESFVAKRVGKNLEIYAMPESQEYAGGG